VWRAETQVITQTVRVRRPICKPEIQHRITKKIKEKVSTGIAGGKHAERAQIGFCTRKDSCAQGRLQICAFRRLNCWYRQEINSDQLLKKLGRKHHKILESFELNLLYSYLITKSYTNICYKNYSSTKAHISNKFSPKISGKQRFTHFIEPKVALKTKDIFSN
jgi:hypothetical protein